MIQTRIAIATIGATTRAQTAEVTAEVTVETGIGTGIITVGPTEAEVVTGSTTIGSRSSGMGGMGGTGSRSGRGRPPVAMTGRPPPMEEEEEAVTARGVTVTTRGVRGV